MACCGGGCGRSGSVLVGALAIAFVGVAIGGIHSWTRPVTLRVDQGKLAGTVVPASAGGTSSSETPKTPETSANAKAPPVAPPADVANAQASRPQTPEPPAAGTTLGFEINADQAKMLYDMGVPFIDAREANFFAEGHVERALNITADQVFGNPANTQELMRYRPGPIVIYCSGGDCDASHHVAQRLQDMQYTQIHIMIDGYPAWKGKGYPVVERK